MSTHTHSHGKQDYPTASEHHIVTPKTYMINLVALAVLMGLTVGMYYIHLGNDVVNLGVALIIAVAKMVCIMLIFMHVRWSSRLAVVFAFAGFFWFLIMIVITFMDYTTRYTWFSPFNTPPPFGG